MQQDRGDKADVEKIRQQQHTGNHEEDLPERKEGGADEFGGTRTGAENVEPVAPEDARKRPGA